MASASDLAGTLDYMAPELLQRRRATVQSDLYSTGVLIHQVLAKEFPFSRDSVTQMVGEILGEQSDATLDSTVANLLDSYRRRETPRDRTPGVSRTEPDEAKDGALVEERRLQLSKDVPTELTEIVGKLLRRRPEERYRDAGSVLKDLAAASRLPLPVETAATRESFLQATELVGRSAELDELSHALEQAKQGQSSFYLIGGESGIGKSRLMLELRTQALVRGFWVAEAQSVSEGGGYYQEWLPLLRALCFRTELSDAEASVWKDLLPDIGELLQREVAAPPKVRQEELLIRLAHTLMAVLRKLDKPLLLILEDLHWVRSESLTLLEKLMKLSADSGLAVLLTGTYRTDESPDLPQRLPGVKHLGLSRLARAEIARLSESMLGPVGRREEIVEYLLQHTEGNVFFLIEIVRALAEDAGELRRIGEGMLPEKVLTVGIERIAERRLDHVEATYLPLLEFAATLSRRLNLELLAHAFPHLELRTCLDHCANAAVFETQGSEWRFAHDKLREALLRRIPPPRRPELHRRVGEELEATYTGAERDSLSAQLAFHFAQGQRPDRACPYYMRAAEQAVRLGLLSIARNHYRDALTATALLPDSAAQRRQRIDLLLKLMQTSQIFDPLEVQLQRQKEAQELLDSLRTEEDTEQRLRQEDRLRQGRLDYLTGRAYYYNGRIPEAITLYKRVLQVAQDSGDPELNAMPAAVIGMAMVAQGHMGKARPYLLRAVEPLRQMGSEFESALTDLYVAASLAMTERYAEGLHELELLESRGKQMKQAQIIAIARIFQSIVYGCAMHFTRMLEVVTGIGAAALKQGEKIYANVALGLEARALCGLGRIAEAGEILLRQRAIASEFGGKSLISDWFVASDAEIMLLSGDPAAAIRIAQPLSAASRAGELLRSWGIAERVWAAAISRRGGSAEEVAAHMQESLRALKSGDLHLDAGQTELWWGQTLRERGDPIDAAEHFAKAVFSFAQSGCGYAVTEVQRIAASVLPPPEFRT